MTNMRNIFFIFFILLCTACAQKREVPALVRASEPGFTGVARCAACHTDNYAEWRQSLHSVAMAVPNDTTVVGDFNNASHTYAGVRSRMFREGNQYYMETPGKDGERAAYPVDYTIGVRQHQAYLTALPKGRWQVLPLYHDGATDSWVDAQEGGVVGQARPLKKDDYYYWTNSGRTWNFHCFDCHASRVQKHYDVKTDTYRTTVGSLAIDCEACHGPAGKHDETRGQANAPMHLVVLKTLEKEQAVEVCAQCHAAKEIVATGYLPGDNFYDYYQLVLPDDEKIFYPDGQPRVYLYPTALHFMSPCYINDELRCTTCHDSHGTDRDVDLIADRTGVGLCEACHGDIAANPVAHGHHKPGSVGNQCVQCHMPYHYVTGENLTDHRIESPVPQNTVVNGVPNSCNQIGCHADQSAQWASSWASQWYGDYQNEVVARTSAVSGGQKGDRRALEKLISMARDETSSAIWRATAASLLGRLGEIKAVPTLVAAMDDAHPMVRVKATVALGQLKDARALPVLIRALSDSSRAVRVQAPFALMDVGYVPDASVVGKAFEKALSEHREVVYGVQGDDPGFHESLGQVYEQQGRFEDAAHEFEIVARLDPQHPETAADLARLVAKRTRFEKFSRLLERGGDARLRGALMLQHGRYKAAAAAFGEADAHSAVLHTARGSALWGSGDREGALRAYSRALDVMPRYQPAIRQLVLLAFSAGGETGGDVYAFEEMPVVDWAKKGATHALSGEWGLARAAFGRALEMEASGTVTFGLGKYALAQVRVRADSVFAVGHEKYAAGDIEGALPYYETVVKLNPQRADVHAMQGLILADTGHLDRAEAHLWDALLIDPFYVPALTVLGTVLQERGDLNKALAMYRLAWALEPTAPGLELFMAQVYALQGNRDSALTVLQRVVKREPGNEPARDLLQQLGGREL